MPKITDYKTIDLTRTIWRRTQNAFIATTAVILLALGSLAFLLATLSAATFYADSVERREARIQKQLNDQACQDTKSLLIAKDYFLEGSVYLKDFDCVIQI